MLEKFNKYQVLKVFLDVPEGQFHLRQLARMIGLSTPTVATIVRQLKADGLLSITRARPLEIVTARRESEQFISVKRVFNLYRIAISEIVPYLVKAYAEPESIVLFGSFSRGDDISKSDIDIAVVTTRSLSLNLKRFERALSRNITLHEVQLDRCSKEFVNNLVNGIVLYGYLKVC